MLDVDIRRVQGNFRVDAAFTAREAGVTALFGHSGAGKTSIISMVAGLAKPDAGRIVVNGRVIFDGAAGVNLPPEKRRFGYVFQDGRLFPHLSVRGNLNYGWKRVRGRERRIGFDSVVDLLGIGHLLDRIPAKLSGGEKQRVAIGRSLLASPDLLLMDEPLASLDAARKAEVMPFIARLPRELDIPILYVTHSVDEILNLADTLVFLADGSPRAVGPVEEVTAHPDFQAITGGVDAGAVLATTVDSHDEDGGLTRLRFAGGILAVPKISRAEREPVRVRIHPRSVAIAVGEIPRTTIQNVYRGTVESISGSCNGNGGLVDVRLDIGTPLVATVTRRAVDELGIEAGKEVLALVKSVSVSLGSGVGGGGCGS
ncbi:MAG: molybdenum ABC transporter ATP-binding protein [Desulfococcaceae bacterium]